MSVRNALEARAAIAGGADIVDVKEPLNGPMGRAAAGAIGIIATAAIVQGMPVTAALGELDAGEHPDHYSPPPGVRFFKLALAGWGRRAGWAERLDAWRARLDACGAGLVAAAYADWEAAGAPSELSVLDYAAERRLGVVLLDTFVKSGPTLRQLFPDDALEELVRRAHDAGLRVAVAGSLAVTDVPAIVGLGADIVAVRGAACGGGRDGVVELDRVKRLARALAAQRRRLP